VFAAPLEQLLDSDRLVRPTSNLPIFCQETFVQILTNGAFADRHCIIEYSSATLSHAAHAGLELEGIFRVAGAKTRMTELVTTLNSGSPIAFHRDENPAIVSSLVKQFLRDLPCPLLTFALYSEFMALAGKPVDEMLANFLQLHAKLPPANQTLLRHLIRLAFIIAQNQDVNRMSESNLAKVIGPNILYSQTEGVNLESINAVNTLLETLIIHYPELFEDKAAAATRWFDDLIPSDAPVRNSAHPPRGTRTQAHKRMARQLYAVFHRKLHGHSKSILSLALGAGDTVLWSGDSRGIVRIYNTDTITLLEEFDTEAKSVMALLNVNQDMWVGTVTRIEVRNAVSGALVKQLPGAAYNLCRVEECIWVGDAGKISVYSIAVCRSSRLCSCWRDTDSELDRRACRSSRRLRSRHSSAR